MINPAYNGYSYAPPTSYPTYGNSQVQGGHSPYAPAQPNAQIMFLMQGMMTALQQLSMGWQGFMAPSVAPMNQYGSHQQPQYGPVRPNPQPFSLLPAGHGSYGVHQVAPTHGGGYGSYGPISPNPSPFSLLPAGFGSA